MDWDFFWDVVGGAIITVILVAVAIFWMSL